MNPMPHLFLPQEEDFKKWIREAIREEWKAIAATPNPDCIQGVPVLLTRKEIAGYLHISLVTLHDWMGRGLPYHKKRARQAMDPSEKLIKKTKAALEKEHGRPISHEEATKATEFLQFMAEMTV